jgi:UDP-GlcNAc:undecaprenyl-phosphate/decaprenyl-phosphate GlcNAc-1-phosphate transferase
MTSIFIAALVTLLSSMALTRAMMYLRIADIPNERSSHTVITPKGGGAAIIISLFGFLSYVDFFVLPVFSSYVLILMILAGTMGIIGILDDVFHLSYKPRLLVQLAIALFIVASGLSIDHIPLPGVDEIDLGVLGPIITIFWVVGFINAFNFMDGLHGLAAGGALVVSILILQFMPVLNPFYFVFYGLIFALLGFLRYNFHYGEIFMSDVGSQFLGTLFAVATLMMEPATGGAFRFYIIPLLFLPFIWDAALTFIIRAINRKNVFQPHKEFLFHRLVALGWSHTQVTLLYAGLIVGQGVFVHFFLEDPSFIKLGLNSLFYVLFSIVVYAQSRPLYKGDRKDG